MTATDPTILSACAAALQDLTAVQAVDCRFDTSHSDEPILEVIVGPPAPAVPPAVLATLAAHRCGLHSAQSRQSPYSWELHVVPHPPASPHRDTPIDAATETTDDSTEATKTTDDNTTTDDLDNIDLSNDDRPSQPIPQRTTAADAQQPTPMPTNPDPDPDVHPDADSTPPTSPDLALEIDITRHLETEFSSGALEITRAATDEPTIILGFGGHWGTTTTELTPTEARHVAHTLLQAADHTNAREHGDPHEDGRKQAHHRGHPDTDHKTTEVSGRPEATDSSEASDARRRHESEHNGPNSRT